MAEQQFRLNLGAAAFPFLSDWMGRSVSIPGLDQAGSRSTQSINDDPKAGESPVPQIYYCHNVMPVGQGFKSIAYRRVIRPPAVPNPPVDFDRMIPVKDPDETKGFMGITKTGRFFMINAGDSVWTEVTSQIGGTGWNGGTVSYAYANGFTYICLAFYNVYKLNVAAKTLTAATLTGITNSAVKNITSSSNYLILTDNVTTYWSSAGNPEDFTPSLATGAGSGTPQDLNGQIVAALPLSSGFAIYTTTNIIIASYSGNIRYPWIFKQAPNSGGITDIEKVAWDSDGGSNYAWTSSGLLKVLPTGCQPIHPEATDFLAGRVFEDCDDTTLALTQQYITADLVLKVIFIGSRFLIISYGVSSLTHALIYDTALRRWGKGKLPHADCFEVILESENNIPWFNLGTQTWNDLVPLAWQDLVTLSNRAASAKRTIGFLQADGTVQLTLFDYGNTQANAVLLLGKYALQRSRTAEFNELLVESVEPLNANFSVYLKTQLDGKEESSQTLLVQNQYDDPNSKMRRYNERIIGANHSFAFKGAFNIVSAECILVPGAFR